MRAPFFPHASFTLLLLFAEGLNADYVKGENLEAVVCEEPQGEDFSISAPL